MISIKSITVISNNINVIKYLSENNCRCFSADNIYVLHNAIRIFYEQPLIKKLILKAYPYYTREEEGVILNKVLDNTKDINSYFYKESKEIIYNKLNDYLKENNTLNLDGFVNFRLYEYIELLVDIISLSIEEFIIEKEYDEFIALMQTYVSIQKCKYKRIEIELLDDSFKIYDNHNTDITKECKKLCFDAEFEYMLRTEDVLLNIVVTMAPKELIIYTCNKNQYFEFLETLQKIFNKRLKIFENKKLNLIEKTDYSL